MFRNMFNLFGDEIEAMLHGGDSPNTKGNELPESEQAISDPLVVDFYELSVEAYQEWGEYDDDEPFIVSIAPDIFHKSNLSGNGGYDIELPNAGADVILQNTEWREMTFVEYLRLSFEWAGFPGLQDYDHIDKTLVNSLKQGLLPL